MHYTNKQLAGVLIEHIQIQKLDVELVTDALITFLAERRELHRVREIVLLIERIWKEKYGAATITIETAYPLTSAMKKKFEHLGEGAEVKEQIDSSVIGGARIRIDDRIIDGTLANSLQQLRHAMLAG